MRIVSTEEIKRLLDFSRLVPALERGFIDYSLDRARSAPITNIDFPEANGEMHIKPGYLLSNNDTCVKIVTCFYDNPAKGMPTRDGAIVVADRTTGKMKAMLCDSGHITDMRTAGASAVAIKALLNRDEIDLGLVGTGTQAYWHVHAIRSVRSISKVRVWGRRKDRADLLAARIGSEFGLHAVAASLDDVASSDVVVTATPAHHPILTTQRPKPGAVIVAMGADAKGKRELSAAFMDQIHHVVADSVPQCRQYGELQWSLPDRPAVSLGEILAGTARLNRRPDDVVLFDSTGLGFQDAVGAELVLSALQS
jgi:ornithine cyclodeaminase